MNTALRICMLLLLILFAGCSSTGNSPVVPNGSANQQSATGENITGVPVESSDVIYSRSSNDVLAYKAFGIYDISIDPQSLTGEIIPARNASAIGDVFDSDLTQFLMLTPCYNCIKIDGISNLGNSQIQVGFAIKHPFSDIVKRPDLHAFDVRGILLSKGNWNFPSTIVRLGEMSFTTARANVSLLANADGYTQHFDSLAEDTHYFDPPKFSYDANINPYKRYFVNPSTAAFDPHNPVGHNVMKTSAGWETQYYIFNIPQGATALDFGFVVDCSYGVSAKFSNRNSPWYFLPEFNRKEAWKVETSVISNELASGNTTSTAQINVEVCDWQTGLVADPNYPDTSNLSGISAESDVASVSVDIAGVTTLSEVTSPASGSGTNDDPYIFNITATNSQGAVAGWYYALIAVRDDLQGQQGPMGIPESPAGFPFEGPDIYDYSTYQIIPIRIYGSPPVIQDISMSSEIYAGDTISLDADVVEADDDEVTYQWEQVLPASPVGTFVDPSAEDTQFIVPYIDDVPEDGVEFTLRLTASDYDGQDTEDIVFDAMSENTAPICYGIVTFPYQGIFQLNDEVWFEANVIDREGDILTVEWDFDWDGVTFDVDATGYRVYKTVDEIGFYNVACRITENNLYPLTTMCTRNVVVEGFYDEDIRIDDSALPDPNFTSPDSAADNGVFHLSWLQKPGYNLYYHNSEDDADVVIYDCPDTSIIYNQKIAASMNKVVVAWTEKDTNPNPDVFYLKTITSGDGGASWGSPVTITSRIDPDVMDELNISKGNLSGEFVLFFEAKETAQIKNYFVYTNTSGLVWNVPVNGGQFRDSFGVGDFVACPCIEMNPDGVIFAYWLDGRVSPGFFLLDWSENMGETWNTEMQISDNTDALVDGDMAIDENGLMYFVWLRDVDHVKIRTADYDTEPNLNPVMYSFSTAANFDEISLYVSPNGQTIMIGCVRMNNFKTAIYALQSLNGGNNWDVAYIVSNTTGISNCTQLVLAGSWYAGPDRNEIMFSWVDDRGITGPEGMIYSNMLYKADRP